MMIFEERHIDKGRTVHFIHMLHNIPLDAFKETNEGRKKHDSY